MGSGVLYVIRGWIHYFLHILYLEEEIKSFMLRGQSSAYSLLNALDLNISIFKGVVQFRRPILYTELRGRFTSIIQSKE